MTLQRKSELKRKQPRRDWTEARAKVEDEGRCRCLLGCEGPLEAAHIIGREADIERSVGGPEHIYGPKIYPVRPDRIVPLCSAHHRVYDRHELDLLPFLSPEEQAQAVLDAGSLELARKRLCPSQYRSEAG